MSNGSRKGSTFERSICVRLSKWWAGREDIFWRSSGSGARAKTRGRKGKSTAGQHGDICAIDPVGSPFIDLFTIELKRGYSSKTLHDLIDKPQKAATQEIESWIDQVQESHQNSGSWSWLIISQRNRREIMVFMPDPVFELMMEKPGRIPNAVIVVNKQQIMLVVITLERFLSWMEPKALRRLAKRL